MRRSKTYAGILKYSDNVERFLEDLNQRKFSFEDLSKTAPEIEDYINKKLNRHYVSVGDVTTREDVIPLFKVKQYTKYEFEVYFKDKICCIPDNPTKHFEIGQNVSFGNISAKVIEKYDDGKFYLVKNNRDPQKNSDNYTLYFYKGWQSLYDDTLIKDTKVHQENEFNLRNYNQTISSLISIVYNWPVNFNPEYQRDFCWTLEDNVKLIDSIFNNVDIQKFSFVNYSYDKYVKTSFLYEVLDGKQRLKAILDFYEDRFLYKGLKYSELSHYDKHHFLDHHVVVSELETDDDNLTKKAFIFLNTTGRRVENEHLEKVKAVIHE